MPYKRNPMRCERMTGLARYVISICSSAFQTAAEQWFERTLDDSSNKRLTMPEGFLASDGILRLVTDVARGLVVYPKVIESHVAAELPFMATEEVLMAATTAPAAGRRGKQGRDWKKAPVPVSCVGDRQALHERIRRHAQAAAREVKVHGRPNDLICRLAADPAFAGVDFAKTLDARRYVGLAPQQVEQFLKELVRPILARHRAARGKTVALSV
jgi:adenylosuccinate lyase